MSQLEPLISDLALILICAGIMTLLFKSLKQPIVLGYIVAGFLASPNMPYMPSIADGHGVHVWSEIGVIFLLFALGLEFSFKKILKMGSAPIIAAIAIILGMMYVGALTGHLFGWGDMDCIYLGGMLAMSSTTIIFKAFDDMGLRQKRFAGLVLSVLIIEDILAIVLMVMLSTLAVSKEFEGSQMLASILQLGFFLILWFTVGIYLIPLVLRKVKPLMNDETLLILALALCFGMVVFASAVGFSAAFGAFVMGSILAETVEAEAIEHLVSPVKNLFGAIFFVSVGMMVDVTLIIEYIVPILCIILAIMLGQTILSTGAFVISGQSLKTAMQCSFSLTQIGEFAFILATLGTSLHVTSDFIANWIAKMESNSTEDSEMKDTNEMHELWRVEFKRFITIMLINSVMCIAVIAIMYYYGVPLIYGWLSDPWSGIVTAIVTLSICGPFLWALMRMGGNSDNVNKLWDEGERSVRVKITSFAILRLAIGAAFIAYIIGNTLPRSGMLGIFAVIIIGLFIFLSPNLEKHSNRLAQTFNENLNEREH